MGCPALTSTRSRSLLGSCRGTSTLLPVYLIISLSVSLGRYRADELAIWELHGCADKHTEFTPHRYEREIHDGRQMNRTAEREPCTIWMSPLEWILNPPRSRIHPTQIYSDEEAPYPAFTLRQRALRPSSRQTLPLHQTHGATGSNPPHQSHSRLRSSTSKPLTILTKQSRP